MRGDTTQTEPFMRTLRRFWWTHFGAGRHFWRDRYMEMSAFHAQAWDRAERRRAIIIRLRD